MSHRSKDVKRQLTNGRFVEAEIALNAKLPRIIADDNLIIDQDRLPLAWPTHRQGEAF